MQKGQKFKPQSAQSEKPGLFQRETPPKEGNIVTGSNYISIDSIILSFKNLFLK